MRSRRALLVATGAYSDPSLAALRAPTGDVESLAEVLVDRSIGAFEVSRLVDRPTDELKKEIEGFFADARRDDLLLLYFSCHGVLSQSRRFYFATITTALNLLRATAIEDSFVNDVMQHSRARSIVLILDCCHSGAFGKGLAPKSALTVDVEQRFEGRGRVTLSASTELQYAFEAADPATGMDELGAAAPGSLFTDCLVEGLATGDADTDGDGSISVDELYDYVRQRMHERGGQQTPSLAGDVRGDIVIARSPRVVPAPPDERVIPPAYQATPQTPGPPPSRRPRFRIKISRPGRRRPGSQQLVPLAQRELARTRDGAAIEPVTGPYDDAEETADIVDCTVFAPPRAQPSQPVLVQVFAHLLEQAQEVTALAQRFDHAARARAVQEPSLPDSARRSTDLRAAHAGRESRGSGADARLARTPGVRSVRRRRAASGER